MSVVRIPILVIAVLCCFAASGQSTDDPYYPYEGWREEWSPPVETDSSLFYRAVRASGDIFGDITEYGFVFSQMKRRGQEYFDRRVTVDGVVVPSRFLSALRMLKAEAYFTAGMKAGRYSAGGTGGVAEYYVAEGVPSSSRYGAVGFTDRNYSAAVKFSAAETFGNGWNITAMLDARTGRDLNVEGVFTNAMTFAAAATKRFSDKHSLSLLLIMSPSAKGLRSASTDEAFSLLGDNYYNPSWGMQNGKVRNSRIRREFVPFGAVTYRLSATDATSLSISLAVNTGTRRLSALAWYDATTPAPDNYRKMPSYYPTGSPQHKALDEAWRGGDRKYTQIDWDGLYAVNRMAGVRYAVEDRVERITDLRLSAHAETVTDDRLTIGYGLRIDKTSSRYYKQMRDLLGGESIADTDYFLVDDDTFGNSLHNDLRNPDRAIRQGDRFGYDYALSVWAATAVASARYSADKYSMDITAEIGSLTVRRRGYYEKELFPADKSYGLSPQVRFSPYAVKAQFGWSATPRHYLEAVLAVVGEAPYSADLFLQPQYNNRTVDGTELLTTYAAELNCAYSGRTVELRMSLFAVLRTGGVQTMRYFDDLAGCYCDMAVTDIDRSYYGMEAAANIRLSRRWRAGIALSVGQYAYSSNPVVRIYADADNRIIDSGSDSYMGGCYVGGTPQITSRATVNYFGPKGWGCEVAASYAGSRYVEPAFLRRTARVATQAGLTPEIFDALVSQERLDDAFSLDATVFKSFRFGLSIMLSVRNILNSRNTVYDGYEPLRLKRAGGAVLPFDTRYTYALPRSFYISVSYKF